MTTPNTTLTAEQQEQIHQQLTQMRQCVEEAVTVFAKALRPALANLESALDDIGQTVANMRIGSTGT